MPRARSNANGTSRNRPDGVEFQGYTKSGQELFEVEALLGARRANNKWEYLIKWWGYNDDENSWEPAANVYHCEGLIEGFWKRKPPHLQRSKKLERSEAEIFASANWIRVQKARFRATFKSTDDV